MDSVEPKILYLDLELSTNQNIIENYGLKLWYTRMAATSITRDFSLFCASWQWISGGPDNKVHNVCVDPKNVFYDHDVVATVWKLLNEADIVIGHNMKNFDVKKFNTRAIFYGMLPPRPFSVIDTLAIARRNFGFTSNKLAYLARFLGLDAKDQAPDWKKIIEGDVKEIKHMVKYCNQDIKTGVQVYEALRPWDQTHPNLNAFKEEGDEQGCPCCGSTHLVKNKTYRRKNGDTVNAYRCGDCGHQTSDNYKHKKQKAYFKTLKA